MFDLIFDAFSAWNQIMLMLMGLVFLTIGGGMIAYEAYWRHSAIKVKAKIIGVYAHIKPEKDETEDDRPEDQQLASQKPGVFGWFFGGLFLLLFMAVPLVFVGVGVTKAHKYYNLTANGVYAQGEIVRNERHYDSDNGESYRAVVGFRDQRGAYHEYEENFSFGSEPSFERGTKIGVYYDAHNPREFIIDDYWHNMAFAMIFGGFGSAFLGFFVLMAVLSKKNPKDKTTSSLTKKRKQSFAEENYYPVYEYVAPNGERMEKVADNGANYIFHSLPGQRLTLLMRPGKPESVRRPLMFLYVFGAIFFTPGVVILYIALTSFEFNIMVPVLILGALLMIALKIRGFILKLPKEERDKFWADFKEQGFSGVKVSSGPKDKGRALTTQEIRSRIIYHTKAQRVGTLLMFVISLGLGVGAYYAGEDMRSRIEGSLMAQGVVTSMESRRSDDSYIYHARVRFTDAQGNTVRFLDSVGSSHPSLKTGDDVDVLYKADKPKDAIIDRGIWNWGLSLGLAAGACLMLFLAIHTFLLVQRYGSGSQYRSRM